MRAHNRVISAVAACILAACGPTPGADDGDGHGDGGAAGDVDGGGTPLVDGAGPGPQADAAGCGQQEEDIEVINNGDPPDLLIVLDRSGSMSSPADPFNLFGPTMWDVMVSALQTITAANDGNIRFGLAVYPTHDECGVAPGTEVAIGDNTAAAISSWLGSNGPDGWTPSHTALANALEVYQSIPVNPEGRYVLFATDGAPNCGGGDPETTSNAETVAAVEALAQAGISTYVLGFGSLFGLDTPNLNECALAGGVPKPGGPPHYYHAANADELDQALEQIAGGIIVPSCSYTLASLPPDPDLVTVTIDGEVVPRSPSHTNGWDYHPDEWTITFFGDYCDQIESGAAGNVRFAFGCPGPVID
jgi:hypothetical protein